MKPREFLQVAVELSRSAQPARLRTAISRAYYAVYHEGLQLLADFGFRVSKGPAGHGEVRHRLANAADADLARVARQMADLHAKRIAADYRLAEPESEKRATVPCGTSRMRTSCASSRNTTRTCPSDNRMSLSTTGWVPKCLGLDPACRALPYPQCFQRRPNMTASVQQLLNSFEALTDAEKQEAVAEVLRRSLQLGYPPLPEGALVAAAEELFLDLDVREAADAQP